MLPLIILGILFALYFVVKKKDAEKEVVDAVNEVADAEKEVVEKTAEKTNAVVKLLSAQEKLDITAKKCNPSDKIWDSWASKTKHKAIAITPNCKYWNRSWNKEDVKSARAKALSNCSKRGLGDCGIFTESFEEFPQPY